MKRSTMIRRDMMLRKYLMDQDFGASGSLSWEEMDLLTRPVAKMGHGRKISLLTGEEARLFGSLPGLPGLADEKDARSANPAVSFAAAARLAYAEKRASDRLLPPEPSADCPCDHVVYLWRCSRCGITARRGINRPPDGWWSSLGAVFCAQHYCHPHLGIMDDESGASA